MKAIRIREFGPPEVMKLEEVPDLHPGLGQVVVRIEAAGVNPTEAYQREGRPGRKNVLPYTPGTDGAGFVEEAAPDIARVRVGQRVYTSGSLSGTYAEKALCEERHVHPLPDGVTFGQGAAVHIPYATAYHTLHRRAEALPGETVLVHGATGGVGLAAVQIARAAGLSVIATGGTDKGRQMVRDQGASFVLDHTTPGYLDQVIELTGGRGVDVILEMLANVNLGRDLRVLARGGRLVVIGSRGRVEIDPRDIMAREASVLGTLLYNLSDAEVDAVHCALGAGLRDGTLRPVVGREIPLAEAARAHHLIMEQSAYGKIVLAP